MAYMSSRKIMLDLQEQIEQKDEMIQKLETELKEKDKQIESLNSEIRYKDILIADFRKISDLYKKWCLKQ